MALLSEIGGLLVEAGVARGVHCDGVGVDLELDLGGGELPGADALLEEHVQLRVGPVLGLGQTEVRPDEREPADTGPEKAGLPPPVPSRGVDLCWDEEVVDDT